MGLWLFAYFICGCRDITLKLHLEECWFLSKWGYIELKDGSKAKRPPGEGDKVTDSWRRLMLCVPRDTFKTTIGTRATSLWAASKDPEITVGIFNEAESNVKSWLGSIRNVIECSKLYQDLWKELLPTGIHYEDTRSKPRSLKWGDTGLLFNRDSLNVSELTFEPFGIGGAHTGKHFTHKIYDDIIGEKSAESAAIMQDAIHFVDHGRAIERPSDNGCELANYTRWAYMDVYAHMLRKWPNDYKVYHRSLLEHPETGEPDVVNGTSIFPERFPTGKCKEMYKADPFVFMSQRQCIPQAGRDTSFQPEWVRYGSIQYLDNNEPFFKIEDEFYDPTIMHNDVVDLDLPPQVVPLSWMDISILLDPAPTTKTERSQEPGAANGIIAVGKDPWGRLFAFEAEPLKEDPVSVLQRIVGMAQYWYTDKAGIEEVNFSKVYNPLWTALMRHDPQYRGISFRFFPLLTEGKHKDVRTLAMSGPHSRGMYYYNREDTGYLVQQLLEYPHSEARDLIDALAYADRCLIRMETPQELEYGYWTEYERSQGKDQYTGY
jgi:hypothetical protein